MVDSLHRSFYTVVRAGSYTRAAEELHLSQSAVSQQVHKLEELYRCQLLHRKGHHMALNPTGAVLFSYIEQVYTLTAPLSREIRNAETASQRYAVGASLTIGEYLLPEILIGYKKTHPSDEILLQVENTDKVCALLLQHQLDLGFVEGHFDEGLFEQRLFAQDTLIPVAASSYRPQRKLQSIADLICEPLILREEGSGTRRIFEEALLNSGISLPQPYMSIGSFTAIKNLVLRNLGVTVISKIAVAEELASGRLVELPLQDFAVERELRLIYRKDSPYSFVRRFSQSCLHWCTTQGLRSSSKNSP